MDLLPLGSLPRFTIERKMRPVYVVRWEYDGHRIEGRTEYGPDGCVYEVDTWLEPTRREQVKTYFSKHAAYLWIARRMVFARRDQYAADPPALGNVSGRGCLLCRAMPAGAPDNEPLCRYHDDEGFRRLVNRLARWLKWRDGLAAGGRQ
jgi:hypothetical protein